MELTKGDLPRKRKQHNRKIKIMTMEKKWSKNYLNRVLNHSEAVQLHFIMTVISR